MVSIEVKILSINDVNTTLNEIINGVDIINIGPVDINDVNTTLNEIINGVCEGFDIDRSINNIVVCHSQEKHRILHLLQTVNNTGLVSGDELLILIINTNPIANLYLQNDCINEDAMLARLPVAVVPNDVDAPIKIKRIFDVLEEEGKLCGLILLALLRWRDNEAVLKIVESMILLGNPVEIAPHASISFTPEDFDFIQRVWNPPSTPPVAAPIVEMPQKLTLQNMIELGLFEELAKCCSDEHKADRVIAGIGFPYSAVPQFKQSSNFWLHICKEIDNGKLPGGLEKLLAFAATEYPANPNFLPYKIND